MKRPKIITMKYTKKAWRLKEEMVFRLFEEIRKSMID